MSEFLKLILSGVISGLIVLGFTWYTSDLRDTIKIGFRVDALERGQDKLSDKFDVLTRDVNQLSQEVARIDGRTEVTRYNEQNLTQFSVKKNIPANKVDSAKQYLDTMPKTMDALDYLEKNLGFTREEAKAVIFMPQKK